MNIALLISDSNALLALSESVRAIGCQPVPIARPGDLAGRGVAAALVDGGSAAVGAARASLGPFGRLLAVSDDPRATDLLQAGADDHIPPDCPPALLRARLGAGGAALASAGEVVEHANDLIFTLDLDERFTSANRMAELVTGYSRDDLIGMPQDQLIAPEYRVLAREMTLAKLNGDADGTNYELEIVTRDGQRVPLDVSTRVLYRNGEPTGILGTARDITRRWRLRALYDEHEAALRESQRFLATLVAKLPGYVYRAGRDADFAVTYASEGIEAVTGYPLEEFTQGRIHWRQYLHPEDAGSLPGRIHEALDAHVPYHVTHRIIHKSGEVRWVTDHGSGVHNEAGELVAVEGFVTDVTEQVRSQVALAEADALLRTILENAPVITIALDREGRYTFASGAGMPAVGLIPHEAVGHSIFERWASRPDVLEYVRRALAGEPQSFDWEFNGHSFATNVAPTRDTAGELTGAVAVSFDTSDRKRAEQALRESEEKFRALAESTSAVLIAYRQGHIFYANEALARLTGYAPEEFTQPGFFMANLAHPDDAALVDEASARLLGGEEGPHAAEFRIRCKDGSIRWIQVTGATFTLSGERVAVVTGFDITERREAEAALRGSEEKFRALAESTDAVILAYRGGEILYANAALIRTTGYSAAELAQPGFFARSIIHREDGEGVAQASARLMAGEDGPHTGELRLRCKDGSIRWVQVSGSTFTLAGEPAAMVTGWDITDRREAEEALRESRQGYQDLVQSLEAIVWEADAHTFEFSFVSPQAERILGYPVSRWLEDPSFWVEHLHPEDREPSLNYCVERTAALQDHTFEYRMIAADGREVWIHDLVTVQSENGTPTTIRGVMIDITEQKHTEKANREIEEYLRSVLAAAPVVLWAIDRDANFTLLEGQLPNFEGPTNAFLGKSILKYSGLGRGTDNIGRALAGESFTDFTENDGLTWETHYSPLHAADGSVSGVIGVSTDVTERRRAEQAILQAQKLESLGILAGGVAHDFNNLLVAILGNAGIALMELSANSPARDTIREIERAGHRAADLAHQMLAYSGKGKFEIELINLSELVEEIAHLLRVSIAKDIAMVNTFDPALPPIEADPTQVRQVVMNLVVNASDAIGAGPGTISVTTSIAEETPESLASAYLSPELPGGTYVSLEVADTGCGMDQATLARIFDPFFTTKFTGRGLGLAAVLGIIRGHRGAIRIRTEAGAGTTFRVLLPAYTGAATGYEPTAAAEESWQGKGIVLVADDEESVRTVTARALGLLGFEVVHAPDGAHAIEMVVANPGLACAILDMTMPGMGGEAAFAEIRRIAPGLPVVIMSGYSEQEATARFPIEQQPAAFIQKPYEFATLRNVMRRAVEGDVPDALS